MIQTGDFVKLNYTGKLSDGTIFDTTKEEVAKEAGLSGVSRTHPITVCVGQRMLIPGLDDALIGRSGTFSVTVTPDKAFGKKDPKLLKIVPTKQLLQQQIRPVPGMRLNVDGNYGTVRTASPDRTVVDFNHPLASQEVTYDVEIVGTVTDTQEQIKALLDPIGIPYEEVVAAGENATIKLPRMLPQPYMQAITDRITKLTSVKNVSYEQGKRPESAEHKHDGHEHGHGHKH